MTIAKPSGRRCGRALPKAAASSKNASGRLGTQVAGPLELPAGFARRPFDDSGSPSITTCRRAHSQANLNSKEKSWEGSPLKKLKSMSQDELGFPMWTWAPQSKVLLLCTLKKPVSSQSHPNTLSSQHSSKPLGSHSSFLLCSNQLERREADIQILFPMELQNTKDKDF